MFSWRKKRLEGMGFIKESSPQTVRELFCPFKKVTIRKYNSKKLSEDRTERSDS